MKKKFLILSLIMVLIISLLSVTATAADNFSFTVSMTASNSKVEAGSEVLVTVKISNLNVGDTGINSFSAYLSYDTEVFETLTDSSVDGINGWVPSYTTGTGKVSLYRRTFLKTDEEIMQITLKTKSDVAEGTQGEVKLSTIIVSNSVDETGTPPVSTMITIGSGTTGGDGIVEPDDNANTNTNTNSTLIPPLSINTTNNIVPTNNSSVIPLNTNTGNTQNQSPMVANESDTDMPYTGTESNALARIIIGVIFIGLVMYIKLERMNRDIK